MDLGMPEMLFILGLALLIFGPAQLPKIGRQIGKALGEFKRASNEFKNQLEDEVHKLELDQMKEEAKKAVGLGVEPPAGTIAKEPTILPPQKSEAAAAPASSTPPAGEHVG
jgi:sec-independent protein translocase protein TatB